jgi:hypothetical protein
VEDVVEPIIFLLSDSSKMINGIGLPIGIVYALIIEKNTNLDLFI